MLARVTKLGHPRAQASPYGLWLRGRPLGRPKHSFLTKLLNIHMFIYLFIFISLTTKGKVSTEGNEAYRGVYINLLKSSPLNCANEYANAPSSTSSAI